MPDSLPLATRVGSSYGASSAAIHAAPCLAPVVSHMPLSYVLADPAPLTTSLKCTFAVVSLHLCAAHHLSTRGHQCTPSAGTAVWRHHSTGRPSYTSLNLPPERVGGHFMTIIIKIDKICTHNQVGSRECLLASSAKRCENRLWSSCELQDLPARIRYAQGAPKLTLH